ncbi:MAG: DUF349 domain-containing protein [Cyclobacteriaceae bacterium]
MSMKKEAEVGEEMEKESEVFASDHDSLNGSSHNHNQSLESEDDLREKDDHHDEDDDHHEDYSNYSKAQFVALIKELAKDNRFQRTDKILKEIKPLFDDLQEKEKAEALEKFKQEGGHPDDFEYRPDADDIAFEANWKLIRDKRSDHFKDQEAKRAQNLVRKNELLERLRSLVDGEDTEHGFNQFKEIQNEWKGIGAVPGNQARTIWANYNALVDRFYDQRSIYFELKELDRKKNLEAKLELCERAEKLKEVERIKDAVKELNELHHEFKHIGPVPREDKDALWERFKAASDAVYKKRDAFMVDLQKELGANLEQKEKLIEEVSQFAAFTSDRIKQWNQKTKEILELQKKWEAIGGVARAKSKDVNKRFWSAFKQFFANKNAFFKKLDEEREKNLAIKHELVKKANDLKESTDWDKTSNQLKQLQKEWREVGPVPEKFREKVFEEFKAACDHFFNQRRDQFGKQDAEQGENLTRKEAICLKLEQATAGTLEEFQALANEYNDIGFVPRKAIGSIKSRFDAAAEKYVQTIPGLSDEDRGRALLELQLVGLRNDPHADRKIHHKEQTIRKRISKVESDIAILRNNMEFFGRSKNAEKLKGEFNEKLEAATDHLSDLKKQLKLLRTVS